jgi:hypothetical protein
MGISFHRPFAVPPSANFLNLIHTIFFYIPSQHQEDPDGTRRGVLKNNWPPLRTISFSAFSLLRGKDLA